MSPIQNDEALCTWVQRASAQQSLTCCLQAGTKAFKAWHNWSLYCRRWKIVCCHCHLPLRRQAGSRLPRLPKPNQLQAISAGRFSSNYPAMLTTAGTLCMMLAFIYGTAAIMKFSGNREQCAFHVELRVWNYFLSPVQHIVAALFAR